MASIHTNETQQPEVESAYEVLETTFYEIISSEDSEQCIRLRDKMVEQLCLAAIHGSRCSIVSPATLMTLHPKNSSWSFTIPLPQQKTLLEHDLRLVASDAAAHEAARGHFHETKSHVIEHFAKVLSTNEWPLRHCQAKEFNESPEHRDAGSRATLLNYIDEMCLDLDIMEVCHEKFPAIFLDSSCVVPDNSGMLILSTRDVDTDLFSSSERSSHCTV